MIRMFFSVISYLLCFLVNAESMNFMDKNDLNTKVEDFLKSEEHQNAVSAAKESLKSVVLIHIFNDGVKNDGKIYNAAFKDKKAHNHYVISGVIVDESGYIVTTCDTFKKHTRVIVSLNSEQRDNAVDSSMILTKDDYEAKVIKKIPELNIVVLKIDSKNNEVFPHLELANIGRLKNSRDLLLHRCSFMLGKACGDAFITPRNRFVKKNKFNVIAYPSDNVRIEKITGVDYLAVENRLTQFGSFCENAGGALVDSVGRCLGVIDHTISEKQLQTRAIVIPSDVVRKALEISIPSLLRHKKAIDLGITFSKNTDGKVCVETVEKDSTADRCGLRQGDALLKLDNEPIATPEEIKNMLDRSIGAGSIVFTVMRGNITTEVEILA